MTAHHPTHPDPSHTGKTKTPDAFPNGNWGIGPITVSWNLKEHDEIDVTVSVFGIQIDTLTGTVAHNNAKITNDIDVLGLAKGTLTLEGDYAQNSSNNGLWLKGHLSGPGFSIPLNYRIVAW